MLSSVALLKPEKIIDPYFLMYYLNSPIVFKRIIGRMSGAAINRMILEKIRKIEVRLPPFETQKKIVKKIRNFEKSMEPLKKKINDLSTTRKKMLIDLENISKSILKSAFTGKLMN